MEHEIYTTVYAHGVDIVGVEAYTARDRERPAIHGHTATVECSVSAQRCIGESGRAGGDVAISGDVLGCNIAGGADIAVNVNLDLLSLAKLGKIATHTIALYIAGGASNIAVVYSQAVFNLQTAGDLDIAL